MYIYILICIQLKNILGFTLKEIVTDPNPHESKLHPKTTHNEKVHCQTDPT